MTDLVQVGWYCDHRDEAPDKRTHMSEHGKWKKGKWIETFPEPAAVQALAFRNYRDPDKQPHCPRAVAVYIKQETP